MLRDGERREVDVLELVPGDGVILDGAKLAVSGAILRGESEPVTKTAASLKQHVEEDTPLQARLKAFSSETRFMITGQRLLGLACRDHAALVDRSGYAWAGLVGMEDPIRKGVHEAVLEGDEPAGWSDGVNDAPALKRANIGVVVGSATDAAKETADLILLDNNFRTVVAYVLSNSFAEVLTIFAAMLLGWPAPLVVAQILWIHLICDGPADIVLGFEPKENGIMEEKPMSWKEPVLPPLGLSLIGVIGVGSTMAALAVNSLIYIFAYRRMRQPLFRMTPLRNNKPLILAVLSGLLMVALPFAVPGLRRLLGIVPLGWTQWLLLAVEIGKAIANRRRVRRYDAG